MKELELYASLLSTELELAEPEDRRFVVGQWIKRAESAQLSLNDILWAISKASEDYRNDREIDNLLTNAMDNYEQSKRPR